MFLKSWMCTGQSFLKVAVGSPRSLPAMTMNANWIFTCSIVSAGAQSLLNIIPTISGLANCSFVYDTFQTFVNRRCNPLKSGLRHLWIPLLLVSIGLTLLTAAWVLTNHRNTHQWYMGTIYAQDFGPTRVKWRKNERARREKDASLLTAIDEISNVNLRRAYYTRVQK